MALTLPSSRMLTLLVFMVGTVAFLSSALLFAPSQSVSLSSPSTINNNNNKDDSFDSLNGNSDDTNALSLSSVSAAFWSLRCIAGNAQSWLPSPLRSAMSPRSTAPTDHARSLTTVFDAPLRRDVLMSPAKMPTVLCPDTLCSTVLLSQLGLSIPREPHNHTRLFIHVPRTGGSALRGFVESISKEKGLHFKVTINAFRFPQSPYLKTPDRDHWNVIFGHYAFGLHRLLPSYSYYTYFTTVRHPIERWVSQFAWGKINNIEHLSNHNISSWIRANYNCNMQFAILSGFAPNDFSLFDRLDPNWPIPCGSYDRNHADVLRRVLDNMSFYFRMIIPQEEMESAFDMLCDEFSVKDCRVHKEKHLQTLYSANTQQLLKSMSQEDKDLLLEQNHLDMQIYTHALKMFKIQKDAWKKSKRNP